MTAGVPAKPTQRSFMDKLLDGVERVGNKVPHPVLMFAYLILLIIVLSSILGWLGVSVTEEIAVPVAVPVEPNYYEDLSQPSVGLPPFAEVTDYEIQKTTIAIRPILSVEGIRWMFTSFVPTFQGFGALAITLIALLGAGAAEQGGLMAALIRKIVKVAPAALLAFLIVFVGALSSVASDAGYLILIPLSAVAFLAVGRHPIAGLAAGFAGVAAIFMANLIVTPTDAMLFEITNESLGADRPGPHRHHGRLLLPDRFNHRDDDRGRVHHGEGRRTAPRQVQPHGCGRGGPCGGRGSRPSARLAGPAQRGPGAAGRAGRCGAVHPPAGRAAARPADGRHHRANAVHGEPAVHHHAVLPGAGHRVRRGGRQVQARQRRDRSHRQDVRRAGRADLHAVDDQPVHRLLQLQPDPERDRRGAGRRAGQPPASARSRC